MKSESSPPTTDANEAFDVLERNEPLPIGSRVRELGTSTFEVEDGESITRPDLREKLEKLGFRELGRYSQSALGSLRVARTWWLDESGTIAISVARDTRKAESDVEIGMARYFIVTRFDDGSALQTWPTKKPPLPSTSRIEIRLGTGDVEDDLASHGEAARATLVSSHHRTLRFTDLASLMRGEVWHLTRLRAPNVAQAVAGRIVLGAVGAIFSRSKKGQ